MKTVNKKIIAVFAAVITMVGCVDAAPVRSEAAVIPTAGIGSATGPLVIRKPTTTITKVKQDAHFAHTLNLDELAKKATYVPVTSIADLKSELVSESKMTMEQLSAHREKFALIGTKAIANVSRSLNVHSEPNGDSVIVGKIYQNSGAIIGNFYGSDDEWMYVTSGSVKGWVVSKYMVVGEQVDSLFEAMQPRVAVTVCECDAFSKADKSSTKMCTIAKDMYFPVLGYEGNFVKVQLSASSDGYINSEYVSTNEGLCAGYKLTEEEKVQDAIDILEETRRIAAEKKEAEEKARAEAERALAAKKAAAKRAAAEKAKNSSSSQKSSSSVGSKDSEGWKYLGKFRVTFYCVNCNSPKGSRKTASGATAKEGVTCAVKSSQISLGSSVKVSGFGTWKAQDTGVGYNCVDLFVSPDECDGCYYRDVWVKK